MHHILSYYLGQGSTFMVAPLYICTWVSRQNVEAGSNTLGPSPYYVSTCLDFSLPTNPMSTRGSGRRTLLMPA